MGVKGPTRSATLPEAAEARKKLPIASGVLDYFPDAIVAVSEVSWLGNDQHNPGEPLHWAREKSTDEADALMRHFMQRGQKDSKGVRHSAQVAWRALALLQKEIEAEREEKPAYIPIPAGAQTLTFPAFDKDVDPPKGTEFITASGWHIERGCHCTRCIHERRNMR